MKITNTHSVQWKWQTAGNHLSMWCSTPFWSGELADIYAAHFAANRPPEEVPVIRVSYHYIDPAGNLAHADRYLRDTTGRYTRRVKHELSE